MVHHTVYPSNVFVIQTQNQRHNPTVLSLVNSHIAKYSHSKKNKKRRIHQNDNTTFRRQGAAPKRDQNSRAFLNYRAYRLCPLGTGDGDPFNSLPDTFDPIFKYVIEFNRSTLRPSPINSTFGTQRALKFIAQFDRDTKHALQDVHLFYAYFNRLTAVVVFVTTDPYLTELSLTYKNIAISKLRNLLSKYSISTVERICQLINSLFIAENSLHNFDVAKIHGNMLGHILCSLPGAPIGERLARSILWQDVHRAVMTLSPTSFDIHSYVQRYLPEHSTTPISWTDLLPAKKNNVKYLIDDAMDCRALRRIFKETRLYYAVISILIDENLPTDDSISEISSRTCFIQAELVNNYAQVKKNIKKICAGHDCWSSLHIQAWAALATLLLIRFLGHYEMQYPNKPPNPASDLYPASVTPDRKLTIDSYRYSMYSSAPVISKALREHLEICKPSILQDVGSPLARAYLWGVFVGAVAEQVQEGFDGSHFCNIGNWHNTEFVHVAFKMGLTTWQRVATVLEGFLYSIEVGAQAEVWFNWFASKEHLHTF